MAPRKAKTIFRPAGMVAQKGINASTIPIPQNQHPLKFRQRGFKSQIRATVKTARAMEVLDWSLEMLRPGLRKLIDNHDVLKTGDPRLLAARIIEELTGNKKNES